MKKFVSALLVLILALSLAVTGYAAKADDAYALYDEMNQAMKRVQSIDADMAMTMTMSAAGESMKIRADGSIKQIVKSETDIQMDMTMNMRVPGLESTEMRVYYKDGYMYQIQGREQYRTRMDIAEMMQQSGLQAMSVEVEKEAIVGSRVVNVEGGRQLSFVLSGEKMTEMMDSVLAAQGMGAADLGMTMTMGDVQCTIVVGADKLPVSQEMKMVMKMAVEDESVEITVDARVDYTGFNQFWAIVFPDGMDKWLEL